MTRPHTTDADLPPPADSGLYGLDPGFEDARVVVVPVPVHATVSYGDGAHRGPDAIRRASHQVDLWDVDVGEAWREGIHLDRALPGTEDGAPAVRAAALRVIDALARGEEPAGDDAAEVDAHGERVRSLLRARTGELLGLDKLPVVLGGDHSAPLGAIEAAAEREDALGVLHIDAHADLREAYEGFTHSHASIMFNVLARAKNTRVEQVGLRDVCREEVERIGSDKRLRATFDPALRRARLEGRLLPLFDEIVARLPERVWVSFDVDGLDPRYCPNTGTPVPGGLDFGEAVELLRVLADSGRRVVGMDLCEVSPGETPDDEDSYDAVVGARLLYKLVGFALQTRD
jgi:agmatinase